MNLEDLKDKLGDDYDALSQYVTDLIGQRDAARKESIDGRKGLKAEVEKLRMLKAQLFDRLGITDDDELDALPDLKGQAEAAKVYEAKLKRMERELGDKAKALTAAETKYRESQQAALLARAMQAHDWVDRDVVELAIKSRIEWEDDTPFYRTDKGPVSLDDGVKLFATEKPTLLKSHGAGGSGYVKTSRDSVPNPWAKESFNLTEQGRLTRENPSMAQTLAASAQRN